MTHGGGDVDEDQLTPIICLDLVVGNIRTPDLTGAKRSESMGRKTCLHNDVDSFRISAAELDPTQLSLLIRAASMTR